MASSKTQLREYHVIPDEDGWLVERDEALTGLFAHDLEAAVAQAVRAAERDHHNGLDVMVCVQEADGHCRKVWP
ncbi:MAG: DUF2188 domain-containing protein [Pseudomonadota bacterium]